MSPPSLTDAQTRRGLRLIVRSLLRYRRDMVLSTIGALLWMGLVVLGPLLEKLVIDRSIVPGRADLLVPLVVVFISVGVFRGASIGARRFFAFRVSFRAETDLRARIHDHLQRLAFSFHDQTATGELMARASTDLQQVRLILAMLPITIANVGMFLAIAVVLVVLDPLLGAVVALTIPAMLALAVMYARRVLATSFEVQQRLADLSTTVEEGVSGIRVVKAFGSEEREVEKVTLVADRILGRSLDLARFRSIFIPAFELIPAAATVAVLWIGGLRVVDGTMTLGDLVAFTQYLLVLSFPLRLTGWFVAELPRSAAAGARVSQLLKTAPDVDEPVDARPLPAGKGEIRFCDVRFAYPDGPPVLEGVNLHIPAGRTVALVGSTGSGKTTLAHLVPRFYDPEEGSVLIDGIDVRRLRLQELRSQVAVVFEDPFLFSDTIAANIAFGDPDATDEQIRLAARLARAHDFITAMPEAYDTLVGERGFSLSGGQRQRIALARAVLRDPRILILDDATSSVDAVTEAEIREALRSVMRDRTTLIIAHRTSTLSLADEVVLLDGGRIVAQGTHHDLLLGEPRYTQVLAEEEPVS